MLKIKCHTCGRCAKLISSGIECNTDRQYEDFQCGKGHVTRLYLDEKVENNNGRNNYCLDNKRY